jgi:hypothetical protein
MNSNKLICSFGVLADAQYADIEDCVVYGRHRYYRQSIDLVKRALSDWHTNEIRAHSKFKFILQLGDLIEGFRSDPKRRLEHMQTILNELIKLNVPVYHVWGNHEMYAFNGEYLIGSVLNSARSLKQNLNSNYYCVDITDKLRLICLDLYEISLFERDPAKLNEIKRLVESLKAQNETTLDTNFKARFKVFNGAASLDQLEWLKKQLEYCQQMNKKVILSAHTPLMPEVSAADGVCWNAVEILQLIWSFKNTVIIYLAGHYHSGGYYFDIEHQLHHLTLHAILETDPNQPENNSYATVYVFENKIIIRCLKPFKTITIDL